MLILHTGDLHLGDLTGPVKNGKNARRQDTLACMESIVQVAEATTPRPHVAIIAGDLFNRSRVWADTALEDVQEAVTTFIRPLCKYCEHVVLLFGTENHDNPKAFGLLQELTRDEKNLHVYVKPGVHRLETSDGDVQILALPGFDKGRLRLFCPGADKEAENRNATALINDVLLGLSFGLDRTIPSILAAHYTVAGSEYNNGSTFLAGQDTVLVPSTIDSTGVTLACLGHIHKPQKINCHTPAYYCGSPNQLTFGDEGTKHGFWMHTIGYTFGKPDYAESLFFTTPERKHYTYRLSPDDVGEFISTGGLSKVPEAVKGAIVRVRYSCNAEQDKALSKADLQTKLLAAGAFYVAEVLPEDVKELDSASEVTEHEGPAEALKRYLDKAGIDPSDSERLQELAAPMIKQADDSRDADKRTGIFSPLSIEVKNYRSYTEASFSFEPVHMAMVNGQNGVGKSSLFMDAIVDCLYEQTRKEDTGGWVRDGTKSGAITFTFGMGAETYRVIRTRTKSGRGTLAIHRLNPETGEWTNESDTTMKLTQAHIERILGMDCTTFCSIALIRQDAYGLFLEASSDRRMEVLSALLGLGVYTRLESIAKDNASEQRKQIAATRERLSVLEETIATKEKLLEDMKRYDEQIKAATSDGEHLDTAISEAQRSAAMREELQRQISSKTAELSRAKEDYTRKSRELVIAQTNLFKAQRDAEDLPRAEQAASDAAALQATIDRLQEKDAEYSALVATISTKEDAISQAEHDRESCKAAEAQVQSVLSQKTNIVTAQQKMEELSHRRIEAEKRFQAFQQAHQNVLEAKAARDKFVVNSKAELDRYDRDIAYLGRKAELLKQSNCPLGEKASCAFLADAVDAQKMLEATTEEKDRYASQARSDYSHLNEAFKRAKEAYMAVKDPGAELEEIGVEDAKYRELAGLYPKLAAAEAKREELRLRSEDAESKIRRLTEELEDAKQSLPPLQEGHTAREASRVRLKAVKPMADKLPQAKAAKATVDALEPQISATKEELYKLNSKTEELESEIERIRVSLQPITADLSALSKQRKSISSLITSLSSSKGGVQAKLDTIAEAEEQAQEYRKEISNIARKLNDYQDLVQAFGLDGIQYMIVKGVVPEITHRANEILSSMTGGMMAVDIRTEKEQRSTKQIVNSLEVWINTINGGSRPYLSHSGGEKVKISLAVTLGLADVKARRAGVQLGMLFIDEPPFLDSDGTEAYADALSSMAARNPSMRILAISHDPAMVARFPQNIRVEAGENGSKVQMA